MWCLFRLHCTKHLESKVSQTPLSFCSYMNRNVDQTCHQVHQGHWKNELGHLQKQNVSVSSHWLLNSFFSISELRFPYIQQTPQGKSAFSYWNSTLLKSAFIQNWKQNVCIPRWFDNLLTGPLKHYLVFNSEILSCLINIVLSWISSTSIKQTLLVNPSRQNINQVSENIFFPFLWD